MYKRQMKLQKILCLLAILSSALVFIYSLGLMTDLYDSLYGTMTDPNDLTKTTVPGSIIYYDMQGFNNTFMKAGLGLILLSCLLFITNTHSRRKYYVGNFVSIALQAAANVAVAVWAHTQLQLYRAQFLAVDFEALAKHADWAEELQTRYAFTRENVTGILEQEIGQVFAAVLEHAGVYKCTQQGRDAFLRFIDSVG